MNVRRRSVRNTWERPPARDTTPHNRTPERPGAPGCDAMICCFAVLPCTVMRTVLLLASGRKLMFEVAEHLARNARFEAATSPHVE